MRMLVFAALALSAAAALHADELPATAAGDTPRHIASLYDTAQSDDPLANPAIDMAGYLAVAHEAAEHRKTRRLSVAQFLRMSREPGTIVLDARSREKYDLLHVKGAINLSFPDIDVASLERVLPDRNARILIYCNNNFRNDERAFPRKAMTASLNLSSYIALYTYGYRNVYELAPLLDAGGNALELVSTPAS
jgi:phage shock protein E